MLSPCAAQAQVVECPVVHGEPRQRPPDVASFRDRWPRRNAGEGPADLGSMPRKKSGGMPWKCKYDQRWWNLFTWSTFKVWLDAFCPCKSSLNDAVWDGWPDRKIVEGSIYDQPEPVWSTWSKSSGARRSAVWAMSFPNFHQEWTWQHNSPEMCIDYYSLTIDRFTPLEQPWSQFLLQSTHGHMRKQKQARHPKYSAINEISNKVWTKKWTLAPANQVQGG